jgi:hypothetical protein
MPLTKVISAKRYLFRPNCSQNLRKPEPEVSELSGPRGALHGHITSAPCVV